MSTLTVRQALRDAMLEEMERDSSVVLFGEEVGAYQGAYKVSQGLLEAFGPKRVIDTPITEMGFAGLGVGAAWTGIRPIVEFMTFNFSMQAIDQIINSAAKTYYMSGGLVSCPIVFRGPNGAASRVAAQHSQCFASWYMHCPGIKVVAPYDAASAYGLLKAAIRDPNPVVFLEHEIVYGVSFPESTLNRGAVLPLDKAAIVRKGTDLTIAAFSRMVGLALEAADIVAKEGISVEIVDLRSLRPLDWPTVQQSIEKTHRFLSLEEGWPDCGVGSELLSRTVETCFDALDAPPVRITGRDVPMPYALNLERLALPQVPQICEAIRALCIHQSAS